MSGSAQGAISGRIPRPRITKVQFPATNVTNGPSIWRWNNSFAANDLYISGICWHRFHLGATVINCVSIEQIGHLGTTKSVVFQRILTNVGIMSFQQVIECWNWHWILNLCFLFRFQLNLKLDLKEGQINSKALYCTLIAWGCPRMQNLAAVKKYPQQKQKQLDTRQQFQPVKMTWFMH